MWHPMHAVHVTPASVLRALAPLPRRTSERGAEMPRLAHILHISLNKNQNRHTSIWNGATKLCVILGPAQHTYSWTQEEKVLAGEL